MGVHGLGIAVVLLFFLVVVLAGTGGTAPARRPAGHRHGGARVVGETDPDLLADDDAPSRSDD